VIGLESHRGIKRNAERTRDARFDHKRTSFAALVFELGLPYKASHLILHDCQLFLPDGFIFESFENLRGNGVLLLIGKSGYFAQGIFQQFSHKPSLAER
jgi:hypothetical protein